MGQEIAVLWRSHVTIEMHARHASRQASVISTTHTTQHLHAFHPVVRVLRLGLAAATCIAVSVIRYSRHMRDMPCCWL